MRKLKKSKLVLLYRALAILLTVCMIGSLLSVSISSETDESESAATVDIVFATKNISKGTKITADNVELRSIKNVNVPDNAVSSLDDAVGKYAQVDLYEDEYLYEQALSKSKPQEAQDTKSAYLNVAEHVKPNTKKDVWTKLQALIEDNPNSTLYFPDGEYLISKSLCTYGDASKAVSLILSDGAVIKATDDWQGSENSNALIASGVLDGYPAEKRANNVEANGSYYSIQGGTLDCNGRACGISLDGGRETLVKNIHIKNAPMGIFINVGINFRSSDMDIDDVIIECDGSEGSVGIQVLGFDNSISNTRIYDAQTGVEFPLYFDCGFCDKHCGHESGGNTLHSVSVYYTHSSNQIDFANTQGISEGNNGNFYYYCYVENYAQAYVLRGGGDIVDSCTAAWTSNKGGKHVGFRTFNWFQCVMSNVKVDFFDSSTENIPYQGGGDSTASSNGEGFFESPRVDADLCDNLFYNEYFLRYGIVWSD